MRTSYSAPGRSFNWIGPAEQLCWGFRPNEARIQVAGLGVVRCDSGANLNVISANKVPPGCWIVKEWTRVYDLAGNEVESGSVVAIPLLFNEELNQFEVSARGIEVEFVVLPNFPTVIGMNAMSDLNINLSFNCYDENARRSATMGGGMGPKGNQRTNMGLP